MRLRKRKNMDRRLQAVAHLYESDAQQHRGQWLATYKKNVLALEIGCGKGRFVTTLAQRFPDTLHVALEREASALLLTAEKAADLVLDNLRVSVFDATDLDSLFAEGEVDRLYLNFSDPWPKKRYAKRRLTHRSFLAMYRRILAPDGRIFFKTDNADLFAFSVPEFCAAGFFVTHMSLDLHEAGLDNIETEYEERFSAEGYPICFLEARKNPTDPAELALKQAF